MCGIQTKSVEAVGALKGGARFDELVEGDSVDGPPADEIQGPARERIRDRLKGVLGLREKGRLRAEFLLLPGLYFTFWYRDVQSRNCSHREWKSQRDCSWTVVSQPDNNFRPLRHQPAIDRHYRKFTGPSDACTV